MASSYPSIAERFADIVLQFQDCLAVTCGDRKFTYAQLARAADSVASTLWHAGARRSDRVVLHLGRSAEAVATMIAVLKIGAIFVPVDPTFPLAVKRSYIERVNARVIVTSGEPDLAEHFPDRPIIELEHLETEIIPKDIPPNSASMHDPCYIMFTSGSSGEPKGVIIPSSGILRLVLEPNFVTLSPDDVILQISPITFDASTFEIWGALLNGSHLVIYNSQVFDLNVVRDLVRREKVSILWLTAGLFHLVVRRDLDLLKGLRILLAGGDILQAKAVRTVLSQYPKLILINGYGPTENTTFTCCHVMTAQTEVPDVVPIGTPIRGTTVKVLDDELRPLPLGREGELCAGGLGVALGYLDDPLATEDKFVNSPFEYEGKLYRTGDIVKEIEPNIFSFVGRVDNQVKIRGYRVSTEEVQAALSAIEGVEEGLVLADIDDNGDKILSAFVLSQEPEEVFRSRLRRELREKLPPFMIPSLIRISSDLPITHNGKLDKLALSRDPKPNRGET